MTSENTRERDYKHEYKLKQKRIKRLHADMNKDKAEQFQKHLQKRGISFISWLNNKIDEELKGGPK